MRLVVWLIRIFLFFALFAFALNNQHAVTVHGYFGLESTAPLVTVVLLAFAAGAFFGVMAMVPSWWRARRAGGPGAAGTPVVQDSQAPSLSSMLPPPRDSSGEYPPRAGI